MVEPPGGTAQPPPPLPRQQQLPRLPLWWLLFQQSYWHPQFFSFLLCVNVLVPFRVLDLVGDEKKAESLALTGTIVNLVALSGATRMLEYVPPPAPCCSPLTSTDSVSQSPTGTVYYAQGQSLALRPTGSAADGAAAGLSSWSASWGAA